MTRDPFTTATAALFFTTASLFADLAHADPLQKPDAVQGHCSDDGDVFFAPGAFGAYACLKKDGSGVVCGGAGEYQKTCDKWGPDKAPPSRAPVKLHEAAKKKAADKAANKK